MEHDTHGKAVAMRPDRARHDAELGQPSYWFVIGLQWPDCARLAEAAFATAPELNQRDAVGYDEYQVLGCADLYASRHAVRIVFLADLTRMFASAGRSWEDLSVDWQAAVRELQDGPFPAMFLTMDERAHMLICDPAVSQNQADQDNGDDWAICERDQLRQTIAEKLATDWPAYMDSLMKSGRVRRVS